MIRSGHQKATTMATTFHNFQMVISDFNHDHTTNTKEFRSHTVTFHSCSELAKQLFSFFFFQFSFAVAWILLQYHDQIWLDFSESLYAVCLFNELLLLLLLLLPLEREGSIIATPQTLLSYKEYSFCTHFCKRRHHRCLRRRRRRRHRRYHFRIARISDRYFIPRHFLATVWWQAHLLHYPITFSLLTQFFRFLLCSHLFCYHFVLLLLTFLPAFPPPHISSLTRSSRAAWRPTAQRNPFSGWYDMIQLKKHCKLIPPTPHSRYQPKSATRSSRRNVMDISIWSYVFYTWYDKPSKWVYGIRICVSECVCVLVLVSIITWAQVILYLHACTHTHTQLLSLPNGDLPWWVVCVSECECERVCMFMVSSCIHENWPYKQIRQIS